MGCCCSHVNFYLRFVDKATPQTTVFWAVSSLDWALEEIQQVLDKAA